MNWSKHSRLISMRPRYLPVTSLLSLISVLHTVAVDCLFAQANDPAPNQRVQVVKTERVDFPTGGLLRMKHSIGDVDIEAWDKPQMEITTVKSARKEYSASERQKAPAELERVTVAVERHDDEVVIVTNFPAHFLPLWLCGGPASFDLDYRIRVPRNARLAIDHKIGDVSVDGLAGDIETKLQEGEILLHLPEDALYSIDAKVTLGNVNSDFPGEQRRRWLGQKAFHEAPPPPHTLHLRVGYGDIVILKTRMPKTPDLAPPALNRSGL